MRQRHCHCLAVVGCTLLNALRVVSTSPSPSSLGDALELQRRTNRFQRRVQQTPHLLDMNAILESIASLDDEGPASMVTVVQTFRAFLSLQDASPSLSAERQQSDTGVAPVRGIPQGLAFALIRALRREVCERAERPSKPTALHWQALLACVHPSVRCCLPTHDDLIDRTVAVLAGWIATPVDWCVTTHDMDALRWLTLAYDTGSGDKRRMERALRNLLSRRFFQRSVFETDAAKDSSRCLFIDICTHAGALLPSSARNRWLRAGRTWISIALPLLSVDDVCHHTHALGDVVYALPLQHVRNVVARVKSASVRLCLLSLLHWRQPNEGDSDALCVLLAEVIREAAESTPLALMDAGSLVRVLSVRSALLVRPHAELTESLWSRQLALVHTAARALLSRMPTEWPEVHADRSIDLLRQCDKLLRIGLLNTDATETVPWYVPSESPPTQGIEDHSDFLDVTLRLLLASGKCVLHAAPHCNSIQSRLELDLGRFGPTTATWVALFERCNGTNVAVVLEALMAVHTDLSQRKPQTLRNGWCYVSRCAPTCVSNRSMQAVATAEHASVLLASAAAGYSLHHTMLFCRRTVALLTRELNGGGGWYREWLPTKGVDDALARYLQRTVDALVTTTGGSVRPDIMFDAVMNPARGGDGCHPYVAWLRDQNEVEPFPIWIVEALLADLLCVRGYSLPAQVWGPLLHHALLLLEAASHHCPPSVGDRETVRPSTQTHLSTFPHCVAAAVALGLVRVAGASLTGTPATNAPTTVRRRYTAVGKQQTQAGTGASSTPPIPMMLEAAQCLALLRQLPPAVLHALTAVAARQGDARPADAVGASPIALPSLLPIVFAQACLERLLLVDDGGRCNGDAPAAKSDCSSRGRRVRFRIDESRVLHPLLALLVPCDTAVHLCIPCTDHENATTNNADDTPSSTTTGTAAVAGPLPENALELVVQLMVWMDGQTPGYARALGWASPRAPSGGGTVLPSDGCPPSMCLGDALLCCLLSQPADREGSSSPPSHSIVVQLLVSNPLLLFRLWTRLLDVPSEHLDMVSVVRNAIGWLKGQADAGPSADAIGEAAHRAPLQFVRIDDHGFIALLQQLAAALPPADHHAVYTSHNAALLVRISNSAAQLLRLVLEDMLDDASPLPFPTLMRLGQLIGRLHPDAPATVPLLLETVARLDRASRAAPTASSPAPSELRSVSFVLCALRARLPNHLTAPGQAIADVVFRWTVPKADVTRDVGHWMSFVQSAMHPLLRKTISTPLVEALEGVLQRRCDLAEQQPRLVGRTSQLGTAEEALPPASIADDAQPAGGCGGDAEGAGLPVSSVFDLVDLMHHHSMGSRRLSSLIVRLCFHTQRRRQVKQHDTNPSKGTATADVPLTMRTPLLNLLRLLLTRKPFSSGRGHHRQHGISSDAPLLQLHGAHFGSASKHASDAGGPMTSVLTELAEDDLAACCESIFGEQSAAPSMASAEPHAAAERVALQLEVLSILCDAKRLRSRVAADMCLQLLGSGAQHLSAADTANVCIAIGKLKLWKVLKQQRSCSDAAGPDVGVPGAPPGPDIHALLLSKFNDADGHTKAQLLRAVSSEACSGAAEGESVDATLTCDLLLPFVGGCTEASAPYVDEAEGLLSSLIHLHQACSTWTGSGLPTDDRVLRLLWAAMRGLYDGVVIAWRSSPMAAWRGHVGVTMVQVAGLLYGPTSGDIGAPAATTTLPEHIRLCVLLSVYALRRSGQSCGGQAALDLSSSQVLDARRMSVLQEDAGGPTFAIRLDVGQCLTLLQAFCRLDVMPTHGLVVQCLQRFEASARDMPLHHIVGVLEAALSLGFAWQGWMVTLLHRLHDEHRDVVRGSGHTTTAIGPQASSAGRAANVVHRFSMEYAVHIPPTMRAKRRGGGKR